MSDVDGFAAGERRWVGRFGNLRNTVRQELIGRQLEHHVRGGVRVLDVGCGQGTQAIRLARRACRVVGVDPSAALFEQLAADARAAGVDIDRRHGSIDDLDSLLADSMFEVVCAHGLLMYLEDPQLAMGQLVDRIVPGGLLSVTFRNGGALAFRPGMRGQWQSAVEEEAGTRDPYRQMASQIHVIARRSPYS